MDVNFSNQENQILYENRFCSQEDFDIIISGIHNDLTNTKVKSNTRISYPELKKIETLYSSSKYSISQITIRERSSIWIIYRTGILHNPHTTVKDLFIDSSRISLDKNGQWIKAIQLPDTRVNYSACSFMKSLYVFGGYNEHSLKSCLKYDTEVSKWTDIANMYNGRGHAACTVFEGKIVVSGGWSSSFEVFHEFSRSK